MYRPHQVFWLPFSPHAQVCLKILVNSKHEADKGEERKSLPHFSVSSAFIPAFASMLIFLQTRQRCCIFYAHSYMVGYMPFFVRLVLAGCPKGFIKILLLNTPVETCRSNAFSFCTGAHLFLHKHPHPLVERWARDHWKCTGISIFNCSDWIHDHLSCPIPLSLN